MITLSDRDVAILTAIDRALDQGQLTGRPPGSRCAG